MSGAWAREVDATDLTHLIDDGRLCDAAWSLAAALALSPTCARDRQLRIASAIIRRERRRLDPEGKVRRLHDWPGTFSDEGLIWAALRLVATTDIATRDEDEVWLLRRAEAALRTLHKRGLS